MPHLSVNNQSLHYIERGEGPLAMLIHGYPLNHTMWLEQLAALSDIRRVIAVDLRGFGHSAPTGASPVSIDDYAADVSELVAALGSKEADIVGLSMGGYVALALWANSPGIVRSLVLANTNAGFDSDEGKAGRAAQAEDTVSQGRQALATKLQGALLAPNRDITAAARLRTMVEGTRVETIVAALGAIAARPDRTRLLADISVPTLVISGELDGLFPPEIGAAMAAAIPGSGYEVIAGAGHMPPIETPDAFSGALRTFWGSQ
ncbi:MAG: alpha/beta fold hydrolase [Acidimicrobiia bacterium]|nr:alpha/beta fold hydrolase [Acidimicrobiia bacterium]